MGQGSDRDEVDASAGDGWNTLEGHVSAGFEGCASSGDRNGALHVIQREVVEHDSLDVQRQCFFELVNAADFDFDWDLGLGTESRDCGGDAPTGGDVVVL